LEGQGKRGKTGETGEKFDLFRRRTPALNGTELKFSNSPRTSNGILIGLAGLADRTRRHIERLNRSKLTHYETPR
jgi:hypothetical protein